MLDEVRAAVVEAGCAEVGGSGEVHEGCHDDDWEGGELNHVGGIFLKR